MPRFFVSQTATDDKFIITDEKQIHYFKNVLRLRVNEEVTVFNNSDSEYICNILLIDKEQICLQIKEKKPAHFNTFNLTIACAIPKKDDMDDIIDKLTQLEVNSIIPMETERTIVRLDESKKTTRLNRWRKIAQSASEQSQRNNIPVIPEITNVRKIIMDSENFDLKLIPTLINERKHIREVISSFKHGNILILIGPEGDFTPAEVDLAKKAGFIPVTLGNSVLRVSTAAIALASYIKFTLDES